MSCCRRKRTPACALPCSHRALEAEAVAPSGKENQRLRRARYEHAQHASKEPIWVVMGLGVSKVRVFLDQNVTHELSKRRICVIEERGLFD